jgi:hypothetical protein
MLQVALNLKDAILEYYDNYPDNAYAGDILTDEDWATLEKIKGFLEKLKMGTKAVELSNQCLDIILPVMDHVLKQLESAKDDFVMMIYLRQCSTLAGLNSINITALQRSLLPVRLLLFLIPSASGDISKSIGRRLGTKQRKTW